MKKKKWLIFLIICIVILGSTIFLFFPRIKLTNKEALFNSNYIPNVKAYNIISNLSKYTKISNNVNTSKLGTYEVNIKFKYSFISFNSKNIR